MGVAVMGVVVRLMNDLALMTPVSTHERRSCSASSCDDRIRIGDTDCCERTARMPLRTPSFLLSYTGGHSGPF